MLYKRALCETFPLNFETSGNKMVRVAAGVVTIEPGSDKARIIEAEIKKHPTALFFRAKAIKADEPNSNGDYFSIDELTKSYKSFEGVPFFTNHNNQNVENARGKIIHAEWIPEEKAVYTLAFVDREAFPHICRSIEEEYITGVSMGCSVEYSICNICGNKAEKTEDYCSHIRERKGRTYSGKARNVVTGEVKEFKNEPVFEYNYGIKFIELSAVVDPACPSCRIQGLIKNDEIVKKVASIQNEIYMYKTASMIKQAGQQEITQLNEVLKTLEQISIQLIQNRQQVEVEFASDLVGILSELQTFVDELVGAGYGSVQGVPGVAGTPPGSAPGVPAPQLPTESLPIDAQPVASETPLSTPPPSSVGAGTISGSPSKPIITSPKLPITAPAKPRASVEDKLKKVAGLLENIRNLVDGTENMGDENMTKRRTVAEKAHQKNIATEVLSNSWQEKQEFFEYISKVPSIQDNDNRLSVKKKDNSFVIVAESKDGSCSEMVWTYDTLSDEDKDLIKKSPKEASVNFLGAFAKSRANLTKEGEQVMSNTKEAGARSVNKEPEVIQEAQLEEKGLYHSRTNDDKNVVTQSQLSEVREDAEKDVITEAQLKAKTNKLNPRTEKEADVTTEAQLRGSEGVSPRTETGANVVTQKQLDDNGNRTGTDPDVITQKQLDSVDTPWARSAKRNSAQFKSAGDHMKMVLSAVADAAISTGCTPEELCSVGSSMISSVKDRFELSNAILDETKEESIDYSKRLAYWSSKNLKVANAGNKEIAASIVKQLKKIAGDITTNPDTIIDALDVLTEGKEGVAAISKKIDEKLEAAKTASVKVSKKDELRKALLSEDSPKAETKSEAKKEVAASKKDDSKLTREAERAIWLKSLASKDGKVPDTMIVTDFEEIGCAKKDPSFKAAIKSFAKGALASKNVKLAAITNVTISGDTISIAVQTEGGEEGVEIPVGEEIAPAAGEQVPEGDLGGEGLENTLGAPPAGAPAPMGGGVSPETGLPLSASDKLKMTKKSQLGGAAPAAPGAGATPPGAGAPPEAGLPSAAPQDTPIQSLTTDETPGVEDEIPTAGEQQPPWTICPECGSSNVDVENPIAEVEASSSKKMNKEAAAENVKGKCNDCGAEYEALVKKTFEFIITKPTKSVGKDETSGEPEVPEVPALPVAAQTKLDKGTLVRVASNKKQFGHVCPACGMRQCKASKDESGHTEYHCPACGTDVEKDVVVNVNKPDENYLRVKWNIVPKLDGGCKGCKEAAKKLASSIKVEKMIKSAATSEFPMANCVERIARKFGGNAVATFGPCKGKALADCVCGQLKQLGMTKVRHLDKLASVYTQKDPMDECVEDQIKKSYTEKEAKTICNCLKKKFASKDDDNPFLMAFADDVKSGKEKMLTAQDLDSINDVFGGGEIIEDAPVEDMVDEEISAELPELDVEEKGDETVLVELSKETAEELAQATQSATADVAPESVDSEVEVEPLSEVAPVETEPKASDEALKEETQMATAMQTHKLRRVGEEVIKIAAKPTKVKDIEGNVEAGVPRSEQKLGEEAKADSMINKPNKGPDVPRSSAYMGKEKEADSSINAELSLPDVAVDSAYMGKEKEAQKGMPAINNEIKGTVIADAKKTTKEAKKMKEVETVEKDVEAKVPRNDQKLGEESKADSLINEPNKGPDVPRSNAYMGKEKEADSSINAELSGPDVPVDNAFMGHEKEVQKDMPGINDEILKTVQQKKEVQIERIAAARRMKAIEVTAKLLATSRIQEEAYDNVIEALSKFEIDKIASVADNMYPRVKKVASETVAKEVHAGPAIVMESKPVTASASEDLMKKIASQFTIGNKSFDEKLTQYGEK